ncbi:DMT family transporter [Clostridium tyrobutyricum]|uniref:DMT family transporter n=1 Tax=Clostridium tyrobutyricum TaxID=1519 RepID=UPI0011CC419A|nr:DMT family transporter [Clostridium tyrobutyricum]
MDKNMKAKGIGYLLICSLIWGSSFAVVKDSLKSLTPIWNLAIRFIFASIFMILYCHKGLKGFSKRSIKNGIILGSILFCAMFFQSEGINRTTAGKSAFITNIYVILIPFTEFFWKSKKLSLKDIIAAVICMSGIGFITLDKGIGISSGDILCLICGIIYTVYIIKIDDIPKQVPSAGIHTIQILTCGILAIIFAFLLEPFPKSVSGKAMLGTFYCGVFELGIGFLFQLKGQKIISPAISSLIMSLESITACIFSYFILGESVSFAMIIGCIMVLISILIPDQSNFKQTGKKSPNI